jgi:hypothetical protein
MEVVINNILDILLLFLGEWLAARNVVLLLPGEVEELEEETN